MPTEAIGRRQLSTDELPCVSALTAKRLERHKLRTGDILFARRGIQATGLSAIVSPEQEGWLCGTGAILLRVLDSTVDPQFLSFVLTSDTSIAWLKQHAVGAVMPNLNEDVIGGLPISLPKDFSEQRAIAHILGTLDDKIELNRRMNETLEAMARAIFKSWFVDFDPVRRNMARRAHGDYAARGRGEALPPSFAEAESSGTASPLPGNIDALFPDVFEDSALGEIPKGWRVTTLPNTIEVNPFRQLRKGAIALYLDMGNMPTNSARALDTYSRPFSSGTKFMNGDTLVARIMPCLENGKTAFVDFLGEGEIGWGSTEFIVLCPKPPLIPLFAYFLARTEGFRNFAIANMSGTSGRQRVPPDCFNSYLVVTPSAHIAKRFGVLAESMLGKMKANDEESRSLATFRNALLPKLLSGEIRVKDAEKFISC